MKNTFGLEIPFADSDALKKHLEIPFADSDALKKHPEPLRVPYEGPAKIETKVLPVWSAERRASDFTDANGAVWNAGTGERMVPRDFPIGPMPANDDAQATIDRDWTEGFNAWKARLADGKSPHADGIHPPIHAGMSKHDLLDAAKAATADRGLNYGKPEANFERIAARWRVHIKNRFGLDVPFDGVSVALMMVDMKTARLENAPGHADSWIDMAGYAACGAEIATAAKS